MNINSNIVPSKRSSRLFNLIILIIFCLLFRLQGILLNYFGIEMLSKLGMIRGDQIYWNVKIECVLFVPVPNAILVGEIKK